MANPMLDRDFLAYNHLRAERLVSPRLGAQNSSLLSRIAHSSCEAARELVHEHAEFLVVRYPGVYRATRRAGEIVTVEVLPMGVTHDLEAEDPIVVAAMLIQDDIAIVIEDTDGQYYLQAGAILLQGFWRLKDQVGLPLHAIHTSSHMKKNFGCRSPAAFGAFLQAHPYNGSLGPEDMLGAGQRLEPPKPVPERMRGAILFPIRVYMTPLAELGPGEAGRLAAAIRGVKEQEVVYRHRRLSDFEDTALEWLDGQHRHEIQRGLADQE